MTVYNLIESNKRLINELYKNKVIGITPINQLEEYKYYRDCLRIGMTKKEAIHRSMDWFGVSQRTMYRTIELMESPCQNDDKNI